MSQSVDYDQVSNSYNRRYEFNSLPGTEAALISLVADLGVKQVLEVGCGTGHWLSRLQPLVEKIVGLDLSSGMLAEAHRRSRSIHLVRGHALRLPFPPRSFDLIYCVNALHHFGGAREFIFNARKLLKQGGALAVVGMDPHTTGQDWYVYKFFEEAYQTDLQRFPSWGAILDWMKTAGFQIVEWRKVEKIRRTWTMEEVFGDPFIQKNCTSQLILLTDDAYADGLRRIEAAVAEAHAEGKSIAFSSDLDLGMVTGYA